MAAIIDDMGFWLSQRRGAQSDGDFSVLAGAQAYLSNNNNTAGAFAAAVAWAEKNGVPAAKIDGTATANCSAVNSCINVCVGNCHENKSDTKMPWYEARLRQDAPGTTTPII